MTNHRQTYNNGKDAQLERNAIHDGKGYQCGDDDRRQWDKHQPPSAKHEPEDEQCNRDADAIHSRHVHLYGFRGRPQEGWRT